MTFTITKEIVLSALAIYGAALSTWNLIKAIRKDRRAVRVAVGSKIPIGMGSHLDRTAFAHVEVANIGQHPVTITGIAFELSGAQRLVGLQQASVFSRGLTAWPAAR